MLQHRMAARPSAFGDDFGQKIDLTARIREILVNYPPGSTIIKEFLQNADGAESIGRREACAWDAMHARACARACVVTMRLLAHTRARALHRTFADAGASTVKFCVDERSFGTASLAHEKLAQFQVCGSAAFSGTHHPSHRVQGVGLE